LTVAIQVPSGILSFNEIKALEPSDRERYISEVILEILKNQEKGITIAQVANATTFNRVTVGKHLENLVSIREAYKKQNGAVALYFKNGKLLHASDKHEIRTRGKVYSYYKLDNEDGKFIYIQEKTETPLRALETQGGIMIDSRDFHAFLKGLTQFGMSTEVSSQKE
jgi:hypothetical protein